MNGTPFSFARITGGVKWLMIISAVVFTAQQFFPGMTGTFGLVPYKVLTDFNLWQPVTYLFLHGSFFHLLFNLFALWMFGKELENVWGTREFLKFFFICGLGAAFLNILLEPFSGIPVIGASGAIYGLLAAFAIVFPDSVIYLYGIIPMRAKHFVFLIGFIEFLASFSGSSSLVARIAHLGGLLTGFLYLKSYEFRSASGRVMHRFTDFFIARKPKPRKPERMRKEDLVGEVDRILEKVLINGADSLTEKEREIMRRYSSMKH